MSSRLVRDFTYICSYYKNAGMLREQQAVWRDYHGKLKARFHAIVTDDGSPEDQAAVQAVEETGIASLTVNRRLKDARDVAAGGKVRWNWLFSRNLGAKLATTDWLILTDIDHVLPEETLSVLCSMRMDPNFVYRPSRVDATKPFPYRLSECGVREDKMVHPNTWIMTRSMYFTIGGYDELLAGCYGTDGEYRDRVKKTASSIVIIPDKLVRYGREIIADASTDPREFTRKNDPDNDAELRRRRQLRANSGDLTPKLVTWQWERQAYVVPESETVAC